MNWSELFNGATGLMFAIGLAIGAIAGYYVGKSDDKPQP